MGGQPHTGLNAVLCVGCMPTIEYTKGCTKRPGEPFAEHQARWGNVVQ